MYKKSNSLFLKGITGIFSVILIVTGCKGPIGLGPKIDILAPKVTLGSYVDGTPLVSGDYVHGTIGLSGKFKDDIEVSKVEVSLDNGQTFAPATIDKKNLTWTYSIDTTAFADGVRDIIVKVTDTSEKFSTISGFLIFDNTAPLVLVTVAPGSKTPATDQMITIKGEAADPYRIKEIKANVTAGTATIENIDGTYSWAFTMSATSSGTYSLNIKAVDYAGNESTVFFMYDELREANADKNLTADQALKIYSGGAVAEMALSKALMENKAKTQLDLEIDLTLDIPQITVSNPLNGDVLGSGAVIIGRVLDDDAVNLESLKIAFDLAAGDQYDESKYSWKEAPGNEKTENNGVVNFVYQIPSDLAPSVPHTLHILAKDINGVVAVEPIAPNKIEFTFDAGAPKITVTNHSSGDVVNNRLVTFSGAAQDDSSVEQILYSLDDGTTWDSVTITSGDNITWTATDVDLGSDGGHNIKFKAIDDNAGSSIYNLYIEVDTELPTHNFIAPTKGEFVNGIVTVRGAFDDNNRIKEGYIQIGKDSPTNHWIFISNPTNWSYQIDTRNYENTTFATEETPGSGVWNLVVRTKAYDFANNEFISDDSFTIKIDNALDRPVVVIVSPNDGTSIGGAARVTGTASDDEAVYKVFMSLDLNGDKDYKDQIDLNGDGDTDDKFEKESEWYEIEGTNLWHTELNANGELYKTETGHQGTINIRVKAQDTKDAGITGDIFGEEETITLRFDDTLPYVENISPSSGEHIRKTITFHSEFLDKQSPTPTVDEGIQSMHISFNNGGSYTNLVEGTHTNYELKHILANTSHDQYNLDYTIDTEDPAITTNIINGLLYIRLKVIDNAAYQYFETVTLSVDNTYPSGAITSINLDDVTGNSYSLQGTATDTGPVNGIEKIELYITDKLGTNFYKPNDSSSTAAVTAGQTKDLGTEGGGTIIYPAANTDIIATIDNRDENGIDSNGDNDGYNEGLSLVGGTYNWYALFDSTAFEDGEYKLHSVIYDHAGNAHYYVEDFFIKNNKPALSVKIRLDLNGDKTITLNAPDQEFTYNPTATTLTARNPYIELQLDGTGGNGTLAYSVKKDGIGNSLITSGGKAAIDMGPGGKKYAEGPISFTCTVTDKKGITVSQEVKLTVDIVDTIPPLASISNFYDRKDGDKYLYIAKENKKNKWGYWHKVSETFIPWDIKSATVVGHIEPAADTNYNGWDPDVSGTLYIRGHVHDDARIKNVALWIDKDNDNEKDTDEIIQLGTSDSSTDHLITKTNGVAYQDDPDKPETISEANGHDYYFIYSLDTSIIDNEAGLDINIEVIATDWASQDSETNLATSATDTDFNATTLDIMPYIHTVRRTGRTTNRSKYGRYPVMQGEEKITLEGWNLGIDTTPNTALELGNKKLGDTSHVNLTGDWSSTDAVSFTMSAEGNGKLWMQVNDIPLLNNNNDNSLLQNHEDDNTKVPLEDSLWNDDRFFRVWKTDDYFIASEGAVHLSMAVRTMDDEKEERRGKLTASFILYSNSSLNTSYLKSDEDTDNNIKHIEIFSSFDPPEYTDIYIDGSTSTVAFISNMLGGSDWTNSSGSVAAYSSKEAEDTPSGSPGFPLSIKHWASERLCYDEMLWQFHHPHIVRSGDYIHVSYTDSYTQAIKYFYADATESSATIKPWIVLDGNTDTTDSSIGTGAVTQFAAGLPISTGVSTKNEIMFDENNNPLVIYYDSSHAQMRLARSDSNTPKTIDNWHIQPVFGSTDANKNNTGTELGGAVDANGKIHIAGYNIVDGDLIYVSAPANSGSDYEFEASKTVDSVGAVGTGINMSLQTLAGDYQNRPFISYIDNSQAGTFNAIKLAYQDKNSNWEWEHETLPLEFVATENQTEIVNSVDPSSTWSLAVGYKSNKQGRFEVIFLLKDLETP